MDVAGGGLTNILLPDWYRWDQRLFAVVNSFPRLLGAPKEEGVADSPSSTRLAQLCETTGGAAYFPTSLPALLAAMENIVERTQLRQKKRDFGKFSPISRFAGVSLCLECQSPIPRGLNPVSVQFVRVPVRGEKKMFVCYVMLYFVMLCYGMFCLFVCLFVCFVLLCFMFCFVCLFVILFGFDDWQGIDEKLSGLLFSFQDSLVA